MRHTLTLEAVVAVADEVCTALDTTIRSLPALAAIAGATSPTLDGVPVYRSATQQARAVRDIVETLHPLREHNDVFATIMLAAVTEAAHG